MEVLKVNKFGGTYRTGTLAVQAHCEELYYDYQLSKARQSLVTTFSSTGRDRCVLSKFGRLSW